MRVSDLMTKEVTTLERNQVLKIADDLMQQERIRHLPVLEDGEVVGVVSQRDLFRSALARCLGYGEHGQSRLLAQLVVKQVMTRDVRTIAPDAPAEEAARIMTEAKIGCLVVVAADGSLAGILTESDFVRQFAAPGGRP